VISSILTKIESGVIKKPSILIMAKIAKALGVSLDDLIK
jgi:transcriptional regulator with XRE-family HTH domain